MTNRFFDFLTQPKRRASVRRAGVEQNKGANVRRVGALVFLGMLIVLSHLLPAQAQQAGDTKFTYLNDSPAYAAKSGPVVYMDAGHGFYVRRGSFHPLAKLLIGDGFRVAIARAPLDQALFAKIDVLVLANATASVPKERRSAYSEVEIANIVDWVRSGGNLLLAADHAPYAGASSQLAAAFGFSFNDGFLLPIGHKRGGPTALAFVNDQGLNGAHPIVNGSMGRTPVSLYHTFLGQAFTLPEGATSLLTLGEGFELVVASGFDTLFEASEKLDATGMSQAAVLNFGEGRLVVFGEAGGLTAQVIMGSERRFGFNIEKATQNAEMALSLVRWLARFEPAQ